MPQINLYRKTEGCEHVTNRLDLQTLGSQPMIMPKNLPNHWRIPTMEHDHQKPNPSVSKH